MGWDDGQALSARFEHARSLLKRQKPHWSLGGTSSGFTQALVRESPRMDRVLMARLQQVLRQESGAYWTRSGWLAFAVDGTRIEAPHTLDCEQGLGIAGRDKSAPQVFLTCLWHMGTGLPWDYRLGSGCESERTHAMELLPALPAGSLLVADAAFVGYEFLRSLAQRGHHCLVRAGKNVILLRKLGYHVEEHGDTVYLWPQNQRGHHPPLVLRLIRLRQGKRHMALLTSVLEESRLSASAAQALYRLRWGEELFFRALKQTLGRHTLQSRTAVTCLVEADWTVKSLWVLGLLTIGPLIQAGHDPLRWSVARSRDAVRVGLRDPLARPRPRERVRRYRHTLAHLLREAHVDGYERKRPKPARNYPRKKRAKPPGTPKLKRATKALIQLAQQVGTTKDPKS